MGGVSLERKFRFAREREGPTGSDKYNSRFRYTFEQGACWQVPTLVLLLAKLRIQGMAKYFAYNSFCDGSILYAPPTKLEIPRGERRGMCQILSIHVKR
ncbi:hypothetical protein QCA50_006042 [Cerrena zonata]|uniref:Uncharacterized protein n=1 Tax=Cerrena zonata TaxID=2478898 RepID=A0AAW0GMW1_9APHY